ncbi:MAG: DNA polymerase III subunit alpha [Deltaproteobacteria bacterium]|nr:DNA polymerase III subunit alpha [Deltaproteobacteria bacterium]
MKHADFVHLHLHTQYSLLDGAIRLKELFERARTCHMPALAITDHGNMFGAIEFYQTAYKYGIKPIIGCEVYVAPESRFEKEARITSEAFFHLVLLAKNSIGYNNLLKLVSKAYFEGFYYRPRVDRELLNEFNEGLIALSACLHGEIPYLIVKGKLEKAYTIAKNYKEIFNNKRFYLELQENGIEEQDIANRGLLEISKKLDIPIVATNDCHYLDKEDVKAHEVLVAVRTGKTLSSPDRMRFSTEELYFKSPEIMKELFRDHPEAIRNTIEIAERCNLELELKEFKFPVYPVAEGETQNSNLRKLAEKGLEDRLQNHPLRLKSDFSSIEKRYKDRLEEELRIIISEAFASYFLIVADFVNYAKNNAVPVGPGRGSAAGSLVAYALKITEIDPITYGLLFERFLNLERISPPDIDVDFCMEGRDKVIDFVRSKYGKENVAQIITFGKMQAKAVIRDVGRVLDMPYKEVDRIAKLIPGTPNITLAGALRQEPTLRKLENQDEQIKLLISLSRVLEGLPRHASTHAAGVVISDRPLVEYLPLYKGPKGEVATQYAMDDVAKIGLIKFDFLGLKTLTVIDRALKLINGKEITISDINAIPLDDKATYDLLSSGETDGVFQLESSGMKELISKMRPENIDDIIALLALYRPGPLQSGMVDDYIRRRKGETSVSYLVPHLKSILSDTYGVILYQEQVMKIAQVLAGYTLGEADMLRRAMGKKKVVEMEEQKEKFLKKNAKNKIDSRKAEEIFNLMANFAGYGFNKSHSVAYAIIAYQTAYLKANYPVEFMAALLSCEMDNSDKVIKHIGECRERGIEVLPPDANESFRNFTVISNKIRFGLAAVKNVGTTAIESIIKARNEGGPFANIFDFCERVDLRKVNKKVLESLIKCGAFDYTGVRRSQLFAVYEMAMEKGQQIQRQKNDRQKSLFKIFDSDVSRLKVTSKYPDLPEWPESELLAYEKETLGFFISSHPLVSYEKDLKKLSTIDTSKIQNMHDGADVKIGGVPVAINEITTRRGKRMAFVTLEDLKGSIEIIVFAELYKEVASILKNEQPIMVKGKVSMDASNQTAKVKTEKIIPLSEAAKILPSIVHFNLDISIISKAQLEKFRNILKNHPGNCAAFLHLLLPGRSETIISLPDEFRLNPSEGLFQEMEYLFGRPVTTVN